MGEGMQISLSGLRALVTGGGSGVGRAIAETMASSGARVGVCDNDPAQIADVTQKVPGIEAIACDVAEEASVDRMFEAIGRRFGGLDILVNNAGVTGPFGAIEDIAPADWLRTQAVNVNGVYYCTRRAVPMMKAAGAGSIINISSVAGRLGYAMRSPYTASKWAVIGITETLAMELGPSRIRVNAILPGFVAGPRHERNAHARAKLLGITYEEQKRRIMSRISLRALTTPQDIANTAVFLASPQGAHITGQALSVDGHVEMLGG